MHYGHTPITYHHNANIFIALKAEFYAYGVNVIGTVYTEIIRGDIGVGVSRKSLMIG